MPLRTVKACFVGVGAHAYLQIRSCTVKRLKTVQEKERESPCPLPATVVRKFPHCEQKLSLSLLFYFPLNQLFNRFDVCVCVCVCVFCTKQAVAPKSQALAAALLRPGVPNVCFACPRFPPLRVCRCAPTLSSGAGEKSGAPHLRSTWILEYECGRVVRCTAVRVLQSITININRCTGAFKRRS